MASSQILWISLTLLALVLLVYFLLKWLKPKVIPSYYQLLEDEYLPPSQFISISGTRIHYHQQGKGPHLILLHGFGASCYVWRFIFLPLSHHFKVTAIDLPGFGQSDWPSEIQQNHLNVQCEFLHQVLKKLNVLPGFVMASSMGAALALTLSQKYPEQYLKLVLLAPAAHPRNFPFPRPLAHFSSLLWPYLLPFFKRPIVYFVLGKKIYQRPHIVENCFLAYDLSKEKFLTLKKSIDIIHDPQLPQELHLVTVPVLILWGQKDRVIKEKRILEMSQQLPHVELKVHPTAHHHPMEDEPEWVMEHTLAFLNPPKGPI